MIVAVLLLGGFVAWMVIDGALYQKRHRDWPRGRIETIVGFAESMGMWKWEDKFGYRDAGWQLPLPPTPTVAVRLEELLRQETERRVEEKTKVQDMLGG